MEIPSVDTLIDALNSPIVPPQETSEEPEDTQENYILLDLLKAVTRVETKLDVLLDQRHPQVQSPDVQSAMLDCNLLT